MSQATTAPALAVVGRSVDRVDAAEKLGAGGVRGRSRRSEDVARQGAPEPGRARPDRLDRRLRAEAVRDVACVLTGRDLGDIDPYYGHALRDRPVVAIDRVRFAGEPVAVVAAEDEATAEAALG